MLTDDRDLCDRLRAHAEGNPYSPSNEAALAIELLAAVADAAADWLLGPPISVSAMIAKVDHLKAALRVAGYKPRE